ncbi:hypothetical protein [Dysgonomonas mossii]|uniref:Uncharacterized protein n=1 Tax=Dysgonomonas mossii DSM 22836 TaxID=742767 RepID=F8X542_9BACT|nr:hypothetical protein [Dysgonomonas mossii]EGK04740.1 hypothetical protein HMPREF9456_03351 [Dysgonomonas mossii DSM 22836]
MKVYTNDIYPFTIWVEISEDRNNTLNRFRNYYTGNPIADVPLRDFVEPVEEISTGLWGVLIIFTDESRLSHKTVTHEAIHATGYLLDQIGDEINGKETSAYLAGYIADCLIKTIKNKQL